MIKYHILNFTMIAPSVARLFKITPPRGRWWGAVSLLAATAAMAQTTADGLSVSQLRNAVYVSPLTVKQGSDAELQLRLKADFAVSAFQFDVVLPDSMRFVPTAATTTAAGITVNTPSGMPSGRVLLQRTLSDGSVRIVSYSPYNEPIAASASGSTTTATVPDASTSGTSTLVLTIPVTIDKALAPGEREVTLRNIVMAGTSYTIHDSLSVVSTPITVKGHGITPVEGVYITVDLAETGALSDYIATPGIVEGLRVRGGLNGTDIAYIRQLPRLRSLDIKDAWIVEGGTAYKDSLYTSDLVIGEEMFASMPRLHDLSLCDSTVSVGARVVADDESLCYVYWNSRASVPANAMGLIPSNCLIYVPEGTETASQQRIVRMVDGAWRTSRLDLIDALPFECPESFSTDIVTYTRKFTKTTYPGKESGWESIVLPFDVQYYYNLGNCQIHPVDQYVPDATPFWLATVSASSADSASSGTSGWAYTDAMHANTPYIISMPNSPDYPSRFNITGNVVFFAYDTMVKATSLEPVMLSVSQSTGASNVLLTPTFTAKPKEGVYAINDEAYKGNVPGSVFVKELRDVRPFECYVSDATADGSANQRQLVRISFGNGGNDSDGIDEVTTADGTLSMVNGKCYNLAGQRISRPHRGISIVRSNGMTRTVINK